MRKLLPLASVVLLAGCPSDLINGITKLDPKVLAVTKTSATGVTLCTVGLKWNNVLNAKSYQIIKKLDGTSTTLRPEKADTNEYTDADVAAGKSYSYIIRALDAGNNVLTVSDETPVELLPPTVGEPGISETVKTVRVGKDTLLWTDAPQAIWYFVTVIDQIDSKVLYGGFANANAWQIGAPSYQANLNLPGFNEITGAGFTAGHGYTWQVSAIRANKEKLEEATALDIRVSKQGELYCSPNAI